MSWHKLKKIIETSFKMVFLTQGIQFFVAFINFIDNVISNISKCLHAPSKTLKK